eukprot:TRINITY_DN42348_c0_g1_i1.p1 TRINITY_DN42348_c0_g1~~TRINITY_DN42348_c0_g1_i1.p1  ORF type:complete len:405 (-),score=48.21 TRINITY_DN42348_c0_g1_i1:99-1313(-)
MSAHVPGPWQREIWMHVLQYVLDLRSVDWKAWVGESMCADYGPNGYSAADVVEGIRSVESAGCELVAVCRDFQAVVVGWKEKFPSGLLRAFQADRPGGGRITEQQLMLIEVIEVIQTFAPLSKNIFSPIVRSSAFRGCNWGAAITSMGLSHEYGQVMHAELGPNNGFKFEDTLPAFSAYAFKLFENIDVSWGHREPSIGCWSGSSGPDGFIAESAHFDLLASWHSRDQGRAALLCSGGTGELLAPDGLPLFESRGRLAFEDLRSKLAQIFPGLGQDALVLRRASQGFSGSCREPGKRVCVNHKTACTCKECNEARGWHQLGCYLRLEIALHPPGIAAPQDVNLEVRASVVPFLFVSEDGGTDAAAGPDDHEFDDDSSEDDHSEGGQEEGEEEEAQEHEQEEEDV